MARSTSAAAPPPAQSVAKAAAGGLRLVLAVSAFWLALYLCWMALSTVNFFYPTVYGWVGVGQNIEKYGPQNFYKKDFAKTTRAERFRLFAGIVDAINDDGRGLEQLTYHDPRGRPIDRLLRAPEIGHLRDVAHLITTLRHFTVVMLGVFLGALILAWWRRIAAPRVSRVLIGTAAFFAAATAVIFAYGPERLFESLHKIVFAGGSPWFFYYQQSLMSTMMKAPELFAPMAVFLALGTGVLFVAIMAVLRRLVLPPTAIPG